MKALVIGHGSIGSRHTRILTELGCQVAVVSLRDIPVENRFPCIRQALCEFAPHSVVIASETSRHRADLMELAANDFGGAVLVEKPLFRIAEDVPENRFCRGYVAYNMRFHPLSQRLYQLVAGERVLSVQAYVGQYLPSWRPGRDYREVYSARTDAGGGVLRDLSHELDLLNWLLGGWRTLTAQGGHLSHLEIDSEDVYSLMLTTECCPVVSVQMNYLDRLGRRRIIINTDRHSFEADYGLGRLMIDDTSEDLLVDRDYSYCQMHQALLNNNPGHLCTFAEGLDVLHMIAAAEQAIKEGRWIVK